VNNFSEVSAELCEELKTELQTGQLEMAGTLVRDLEGNMEKIRQHGERASGIVRGMLAHARTRSGEKSETDINALLKEYLNLSYHGYRAKDRTFNVTMSTVLDDHLPRLKVASADLSRVFLNIINNGFYSVTEKKKETGEKFSPEVKITTKNLPSSVEIRIRDNGKGIPKSFLEKIYQPFFTTKPTGQGTGLGLSISYDIITNGHGGTLNVETKEGEFAEFTITLPKTI